MMREFSYTLWDQWGNRYTGHLNARNAAQAFDLALKRESKSVKSLEDIIMKAVVMPT